MSREDGKDVFFHYSSIQVEGFKTLKEGEAVEYEIIDGEKGLQADHVTRKRDSVERGNDRLAA